MAVRVDRISHEKITTPSSSAIVLESRTSMSPSILNWKMGSGEEVKRTRKSWNDRHARWRTGQELAQSKHTVDQSCWNEGITLENSEIEWRATKASGAGTQSSAGEEYSEKS